jgi:hypothetical protein
MLVPASPELRQHVVDHGGSLFVHTQRRGEPYLRSATKVPRSLAGYELFVIEDILVCTRFPARMRLEELHLSLEDRVRKHTVAARDGRAYLI